MLRRPKVLADTATLRAVRASLTDDHVHLVLLVASDGAGAPASGCRLRGTLLRADLPPDAPDDEPALPHSRLAGRTVRPDAPLAAAYDRLLAAGARRLAVVDDAGRLVGLLCLKQHGRGFCSDADVGGRAAPRRGARA